MHVHHLSHHHVDHPAAAGSRRASREGVASRPSSVSVSVSLSSPPPPPPPSPPPHGEIAQLWRVLGQHHQHFERQNGAIKELNACKADLGALSQVSLTLKDEISSKFQTSSLLGDLDRQVAAHTTLAMQVSVTSSYRLNVSYWIGRWQHCHKHIQLSTSWS